METSLTDWVILYTHQVRGELEQLPRIFSFLRQLKAQYRTAIYGDDNPEITGPRFMVLDLGDSCSADVWHCQVTGGRSALFAFDSMGYEAANVEGIFNPRTWQQMNDNVHMALIDSAHPQKRQDEFFMAIDPLSASENLAINLHPAETTELKNKVLHLATCAHGEVGAVHLTKIDTAFHLQSHEVHPMPRRTPADPTIAGVIDFVISEARYFVKRQKKP